MSTSSQLIDIDPCQCERVQGTYISQKSTKGYELPNPDELRKLAAWYREFAERAGDAAIWEARLRTAKELEAEADRVEANLGSQPGDLGIPSIHR